MYLIRNNDKYVSTDALPSLCAVKSCINDRKSGLAFCEKHKFKSVNKFDKKIVNNIKNDYFLYFISCDNAVKIGITRNLKKRLSALQMASPKQLVLEANIEAYCSLERALHGLFKKDRLHGEWFNRSDLLDEIIALAKKNDLKSIEVASRFYFTEWT